MDEMPLYTRALKGFLYAHVSRVRNDFPALDLGGRPGRGPWSSKDHIRIEHISALDRDLKLSLIVANTEVVVHAAEREAGDFLRERVRELDLLMKPVARTEPFGKNWKNASYRYGYKIGPIFVDGSDQDHAALARLAILVTCLTNLCTALNQLLEREQEHREQGGFWKRIETV